MLCPKCGKAELIGPYRPGCLSHLDDDRVGAAGDRPAAPAFATHQSGSTQRMAVLLAVSVVMGLAAVAAVVWTLTALWIILIPAAMITLILAVQIEE